MLAIYFLLFIISVPLYSLKSDPKKNELEEMFVQRWSWYTLCDFSYCNNHDSGTSRDFVNATPFSPDEVMPGDSVFITDSGMHKFLTEVHPKIKNPYILVTYFSPNHNEAHYINDPKIIAWLGVATFHSDIEDFEKFMLVPVGIYREQHIFNNRKMYSQLFSQLRAQPKDKLLYMNFKIHEGRGNETTYRKNVWNFFKDKPFCTVGKPQQFMSYIKESAQHKFVVSPWGDMYDCYRHWEALISGSIPVIESSPLDTLFEGLPVLIVHDFSEVTEEFLLKKYEEMKNTSYNLEKLYMKYWSDRIQQIREDFFAGKKFTQNKKFHKKFCRMYETIKSLN